MTKTNTTTCQCHRITKFDHDNPISDLTTLRDTCPALKKLFLPDDIWDDYKTVIQQPSDDAKHNPLILGLIQMDKLMVITGQAHKHLMDGNGLSSNLDGNYKRDLQERWLIKKDDPLERHIMYKTMSGKLFELVQADWLESYGHEITGLAAVGGAADIETKKDDARYLFEVKYVGLENELFESLVKSSVLTYSPYDRINFILSRVYEAAKQLINIPNVEDKKTVASIILSHFTWQDVGRDLQNGWIDWDNPKFFDNGTSKKWTDLLTKLSNKHQDIDKDLGETIKSIDEIWIFREDPGYTLNREIIV